MDLVVPAGVMVRIVEGQAISPSKIAYSPLLVRVASPFGQIINGCIKDQAGYQVHHPSIDLISSFTSVKAILTPGYIRGEI